MDVKIDLELRNKRTERGPAWEVGESIGRRPMRRIQCDERHSCVKSNLTITTITREDTGRKVVYGRMQKKVYGDGGTPSAYIQAMSQSTFYDDANRSSRMQIDRTSIIYFCTVKDAEIDIKIT